MSRRDYTTDVGKGQALILPGVFQLRGNVRWLSYQSTFLSLDQYLPETCPLFGMHPILPRIALANRTFVAVGEYNGCASDAVESLRCSRFTIWLTAQ